MTHLHHQFERARRGGFTLLEASTAISIMVGVAVVMVVMVQQHLTVVRMATQQSFLSNEAPKVGDLLGRVFNQADHFFVYQSRASALAGDAPVLSGGQAVRLYFKTATNTTEERMIALEDGAGGPELRFYADQSDGTTTSWLVSNQLSGADFNADEGILSVTLNGPNGEEVTYCGGS